MSTTPDPLFTSRPPERAAFNPAALLLAGGALLALACALLLMNHRKPGPPANAILPLDPYAQSLTVSDVHMSEADSLAGTKSIYIDGHIRNSGAKTVTAATVQVLFPNSEQLAPQLETLPLALIRTHDPYVDTQPIADAPLAPGDEREFRLIFEDINSNWNQQLPAIHVTYVKTR